MKVYMEFEAEDVMVAFDCLSFGRVPLRGSSGPRTSARSFVASYKRIIWRIAIPQLLIHLKIWCLLYRK